MLIAVGLIQHLCKSKAISHLQQHLGIRSTAGKYSETNSSFSRITSGVCEVPATSAKAFLTSARVHWRTGLPALQQVALTLGVGSGGVAGPQDQSYRTFAPHLTACLRRGEWTCSHAVGRLDPMVQCSWNTNHTMTAGVPGCSGVKRE